MDRFQELKSKKEGEEREEVEREFDFKISIQSPSVVLPLSPSSYWYIDLGQISMENTRQPNKDVYPFRLSKMHMKYIENKDESVSALVESEHFFPIIKDIDLEVSLVQLKK